MTHSCPTRRSSDLYYRVHALLTRKDRRGRASTDGTPRDWTDRDIKSLRPFRPDPSPPKVELWKRGLALALMVIVAVCTGIMIAMKVSLTPLRSEEHTSELQSLMRISYAVFCLKKKYNSSLFSFSFLFSFFFFSFYFLY